MPFFKLKAGSHMSGTIADANGINTMKVYKANGPNNIVEDEQNLAAMYPEKFESYYGPSQGYTSPDMPSTEPRPPGPPSEQDRIDAYYATSMTVDDKRRMAQRLRERAEAMESEVYETERNIAIATQQQQPVVSQPQRPSTPPQPTERPATERPVVVPPVQPSVTPQQKPSEAPRPKTPKNPAKGHSS